MQRLVNGIHQFTAERLAPQNTFFERLALGSRPKLQSHCQQRTVSARERQKCASAIALDANASRSASQVLQPWQYISDLPMDEQPAIFIDKEPLADSDSVSDADRSALLFSLLAQVDRFERMGKNSLRCGFRSERLGIGRFAVVGRSQQADFGGFAMRALLIAVAKASRAIEHMKAANDRAQGVRYKVEIAELQRRKMESENLIRSVILREGKSARKRDINSLIVRPNLLTWGEDSLCDLADVWPREYRKAIYSFERSVNRNARVLSEMNWLSAYGEPLPELSKMFVAKEFRDLAMLKLAFMISQNIMTIEAFQGTADHCGLDGALKIAHAFAPGNRELAQTIKRRDKLAISSGLGAINLSLSP